VISMWHDRRREELSEKVLAVNHSSGESHPRLRARIMMNKETVFDLLKRRKKAELLEFLAQAFDVMEENQRRAVFAGLIRMPRPATVDGAALLEEVKVFHRQSLARKYYAPFMMNSKNFRRIPDETREWCGRMADLLKQAMRLTGQGDHVSSIKCFNLLFELIEKMDAGEEIIFAEEVGPWMIHADEKEWIAAYLTSLAATCEPEEFAARATPLIRRDSYQSFSSAAYKSALKAASKDQKARLKSEIDRLKIRTGPDSPRLR
jgi:hypothetical protein